jgi:hypothetical protein
MAIAPTAEMAESVGFDRFPTIDELETGRASGSHGIASPTIKLAMVRTLWTSQRQRKPSSRAMVVVCRLPPSFDSQKTGGSSANANAHAGFGEDPCSSEGCSARDILDDTIIDHPRKGADLKSRLRAHLDLCRR